MDPRLRPLAQDNLDTIHPGAATSLFWEMEPAARARVEKAGEQRFEKEALLAGRLTEYGTCGFTLSFEDAAATVLYCSPGEAPGARALPSAPVREDAQLITSLFIDPRLLGRGLESVLLDSAIMDLTGRGFSAVEAFGLRGDVEYFAVDEEIDDVLSVVAQREEIGLLGLDHLEGAGFRVERDHPVLPRMRLELPPARDLLSAADIEMLLREAALVAPGR